MPTYFNDFNDENPNLIETQISYDCKLIYNHIQDCDLCKIIWNNNNKKTFRIQNIIFFILIILIICLLISKK
jgi:hypothetical protein